MTTDVATLQERKSLRELLRDVGGAPEARAVVLVGSWARDQAMTSPLSDIDVLLLGEGIRPKRSPKIQYLHVSEDDLRARALAGDDFVQWALRYGVPLKGRNLWSSLARELLPQAPWPDPARKLAQAKKRLVAATDLLEMGDLDAAQEELRFAASHLARAKLIGEHVFPLSRPELPEQLQRVGEERLGSILRLLESLAGLPRRQLRDVRNHLEDQLNLASNPAG
jgi:predicted nucleotidyltransferase